MYNEEGNTMGQIGAKKSDLSHFCLQSGVLCFYKGGFLSHIPVR